MDAWERVKWDIRRLYWQARKIVLRRKIGERWEKGGAFERRRYADYGTYIEHQKTKLGAFRSKSVIGHDRRFHAALLERLRALPIDFTGRTVLCLAARQGSEVRAFIDRGAFAIGIDLNPGPSNRYVVVGDFHALQYADSSVDVVYTNSLDHAFDLDRIMAEVTRVLRPRGVFLMEANTGGGAGAEAGPYESLVWSSADVLLDRIRGYGFELERRSSFTEPWVGEQFVLRFHGPSEPR